MSSSYQGVCDFCLHICKLICIQKTPRTRAAGSNRAECRPALPVADAASMEGRCLPNQRLSSLPRSTWSTSGGPTIRASTFMARCSRWAGINRRAQHFQS